MPRDIHRTTGELITRADYQKEPYVRAALDGGTIVDGKACAWTNTLLLFKYVIGHTFHNECVKATQVQRIKRSESAWIDPYDKSEDYEDE